MAIRFEGETKSFNLTFHGEGIFFSLILTHENHQRMGERIVLFNSVSSRTALGLNFVVAANITYLLVLSPNTDLIQFF